MSIEGNRNQAPLFRAGEPLSASKLNKLGELASYGTTKHSTGSKNIQGPFGTVFLDGSEFTDDTVYDFPFKVSVSGNKASGFKVYVRPGTCNNFVPKIDGKYLDADPRPELKFTSVSSTKKKIVALKVTKDGAKFFPKTIEVVLLDSEEALEPSDSVGYIQIASITCSTTGGDLRVTSINQFIYASQIVARAKPGTETAIWAFSSR